MIRIGIGFEYCSSMTSCMVGFLFFKTQWKYKYSLGVQIQRQLDVGFEALMKGILYLISTYVTKSEVVGYKRPNIISCFI